MTTIVFDGRTLASDSKATQSEAFVENVAKIFKINATSAFAGCGLLSDVWKVKEWVEEGGCDSEKPKVSEFTGILINKRGAWQADEGVVWMPVTGPITIGTGWKWAQAAIDFGKSSEDAVRYAGAKCVYTDTDVVGLDVSGFFPGFAKLEDVRGF